MTYRDEASDGSEMASSVEFELDGIVLPAELPMKVTGTITDLPTDDVRDTFCAIIEHLESLDHTRYTVPEGTRIVCNSGEPGVCTIKLADAGLRYRAGRSICMLVDASMGVCVFHKGASAARTAARVASVPAVRAPAGESPGPPSRRTSQRPTPHETPPRKKPCEEPPPLPGVEHRLLGTDAQMDIWNRVDLATGVELDDCTRADRWLRGVFGVSPDAGGDDASAAVDRARRKLALVLHPDRTVNQDQPVRQRSMAVLQHINDFRWTASVMDRFKRFHAQKVVVKHVTLLCPNEACAREYCTMASWPKGFAVHGQCPWCAADDGVVVRAIFDCPSCVAPSTVAIRSRSHMPIVSSCYRCQVYVSVGL